MKTGKRPGPTFVVRGCTFNGICPTRLILWRCACGRWSIWFRRNAWIHGRICKCGRRYLTATVEETLPENKGIDRGVKR
jgi:hypothetical protein